MEEKKEGDQQKPRLEGGKENNKQKRRRRKMASGTVCLQVAEPAYIVMLHTHWFEENSHTFPFAGLEVAFFPLEGGADFSGFSGFSFSFSLAAAPSLLDGDCLAFAGGCWGGGAAERCLSRSPLTTCLEAGYRDSSREMSTEIASIGWRMLAILLLSPPSLPSLFFPPSLTFSLPVCFNMVS